MWKGLRLSFYHMKNLLIVANWKANKTEEEAIDWLREVSSRLDRDQISNKKIIICLNLNNFKVIVVVVEVELKKWLAVCRIGDL